MNTQNDFEQTNSFQVVLDALLDETKPFPAQYLHRFSDIHASDLRSVMKVWGQISDTRRRALLEDLEQLADVDTLLAFFDFSKAVLTDPDPQVRMYAIRLLWEDDDKNLAHTFIKMMETDEDTQVRATAANALGYFVYEGELEEIPEDLLHTVEDSLLKVTSSDQPTILRRRALESLGFSSRPEVPGLIEQAYRMDAPDWVATSLFAMGRSADQRWKQQVLDHLNHQASDVRMEAARAAGELELSQAKHHLVEIAEKDPDSEVRLAAIWSLSQIGGEDVRETLETILEETDDDEEADFVEDALENLSFTEDMQIFEMFEFDPDDEELDSDDGDEPSQGKKSDKKRGPKA